MEKGIVLKADIFDHEKLTSLIKNSKSFWGYTPSQIKKWENELTMTQNYINTNEVYKLNVNNQITGCYSYLKLDPQTIQLDFFFISPNYIHKGFGKLLMHDFLKRVEGEEFKKILVESDPNAEKFYTLFGFKTISKTESSIKGRFLPVMQKEI